MNAQLELFSAPVEPTSKQHGDILEYLRTGRSLTFLESVQKLGVLALSQRIGELKKMGWDIKSELIKTDTGKHIARYWIER